LGPAFETFIQAVLILLLVVTPLVLVLRRPVARLYNRLCEEDRKEMTEVRAHERECQAEQEARQKAVDELARDCFPDSADKKQDPEPVVLVSRTTDEKRN
jgi:hypothetical protein